VTSHDALAKLGESTAEAVARVLGALCPEPVERGTVTVVASGTQPLQSIPVPAVATNVSYVDGVTGGNIFVMTVRGAHKLAAAMMQQEPEDGEHDLSELELSAVAEGMNQMMAAAAAATSAVLGEEVAIGPPETRFFAESAQAANAYEGAAHALSVSFSVLGEPCRLVQLVPNAFVVRMTRALADLQSELAGAAAPGAGDGFSVDSLRALGVRVWAELGRAAVSVQEAVSLAPGSVVELDRRADEDVDLYVNGRRFATARLLVADDGEWAVRIESLISPQ